MSGLVPTALHPWGLDVPEGADGRGRRRGGGRDAAGARVFLVRQRGRRRGDPGGGRSGRAAARRRRRPVLGEPGRHRGPPGRRVREGRADRRGRTAPQDRRAADGGVDRPREPRGGGARFHRGGARGGPYGGARAVQHPAPRLRTVLAGRRGGRRRLPGVGRGGGPGDRGPTGTGGAGTGRGAAHGRRLHTARAPRGAVRPAERRGRHAGGAAEHLRLPRRGKRGLGPPRPRPRRAAPGRDRAGGRLRGQRRQLLPDAGVGGVRQGAVGEGRRQTVRRRHQPQRQRPVRVRRPHRTLVQPPGRALGTPPTVRTGDPSVTAYLWIKHPGESDGTCKGGPAAGAWWPSYALSLARATPR